MSIKRYRLLVIAAALMLLGSACGAQQGRTDRYDGYTVRTEKTAAPAEVPETPELTRSSGETEQDYVLNRSSMRFHYPDCSGVQNMKESNRWDYHGTRQSVLDMGYTPCTICDP